MDLRAETAVSPLFRRAGYEVGVPETAPQAAFVTSRSAVSVPRSTKLREPSDSPVRWIRHYAGKTTDRNSEGTDREHPWDPWGPPPRRDPGPILATLREPTPRSDIVSLFFLKIETRAPRSSHSLWLRV